MNEFDVIIIGGGPGGATLAALLAKSKVKVAVIEQAEFPRLVVGESLLPYSMPIFERSGVLPKLEAEFLRKPGARFVNDQTLEEDWFLFDNTVRSGPEYAFNVDRARFDELLLDHAIECGATVKQPVRAENIEFNPDGVVVQTANGTLSAKYLVDASGRQTFLAGKQKAKLLDPAHRKISIFAHFEGVQRDEQDEGNIYIVRFADTDQGWMWMIPFKGKTTSVGVVSDIEYFKKSSQSPDQFLQSQLAASRFMAPRMANTTSITAAISEAEFTYAAGELSGERWIKLGDAGAFIDPIFSSGVLLSTLAADSAHKTLLNTMQNGGSLKDFDAPILEAISVFRTFIRAFYDKNLLQHMVGSRKRPLIQKGITSLLAGDVLNSENPLLSWLSEL